MFLSIKIPLLFRMYRFASVYNTNAKQDTPSNLQSCWAAMTGTDTKTRYESISIKRLYEDPSPGLRTEPRVDNCVAASLRSYPLSSTSFVILKPPKLL